MATGTLITIEGLDGAGKSTLAAALLRELQGRGVDVELLREPGGVPLAERIRALVKDPTLAISDRAEALLYAAARAQLVSERLAPSLCAGKTVLLDRFLDSSLAYQGCGRHLGIEQVREVNLFATAGLTPARTLLLRIDPRQGRARLHGRGQREDRIEMESQQFFARAAAAYEELAKAEPSRVRALDASKTPQSVLEAALAAISDLIPPA